MRRRFIAGFLLLILATGAWLGGLVLRRSARRPSATLPNGVRITVEGANFGTYHVFTTDSAIIRTLRRIFPAPLQRLLPPGYTHRESTTEPEELIYLSAFD